MFQFPVQPFPILENENIILRALSYADEKEMFLLRSSSTLMQYVPRPVMQHKSEAKAFIDLLKNREENKEAINWAITLKNDDTLIGNICLFMFNAQASRAEIGYMLATEHSSKGITTQAVRLVLEYGFEQMQLNAIEALIANGNNASVAIVEKLGFTKDGYLRQYIYHNNQYIDMHLYSMLKNDYEKLKNP
jgi:ribosomal-protein-alanine N-acetyltransferase